MTPNHRVLVLGATGGVGGSAFRALQRLGANPIAAVRDLGKARAQLGDVPMRSLDLNDHASITPALRSIDAALLITGYTAQMLQQSMAFLDAAKAAGVGHIVHVGTSTAQTNAVAHWGWHRYVEAYIEKLGFSFTHLRPEAFMQNMWVYGMLQRGTLTCFVGKARWGWIDCDDLAEVAAHALIEPRAHAGKVIPLAGDARTFDEVAQIIAAQTGKPIAVNHASADDFWNAVSANPDVNVLAYMRCVHDQFQLEATAGIPGAGVIHNEYASIIGRAATTWNDFAVKHCSRLSSLSSKQSAAGHP